MKNLGLVKRSVFALLASVALTGCEGYMDFENHVDYAAAKEAQVKLNYAQGFQNVYGQVPTKQSWDFSDYSKQLATRAGGITTEIVSGIDFGANGGTITKNAAIYNEVTSVLKDGVSRTGKAVALVAPNNEFTIYPISAQGGYTYEMYVKIGDEDPILVFTKDWNNYDKAYCNTMYNSKTSMGQVIENKETVTTKLGTWDGNLYTIKASRANDQQYYLNGTKEGTNSNYKYAIIKYNNSNILYDLQKQQYISGTYDDWGRCKLSFTDDISKACIISYKNDGYLKLGNYYIYVGLLFGNYDLYRAEKKGNDDKFNWTWTTVTPTIAEKKAINSLITKTEEKVTSTTGSKNYVYMPGLKVNAPIGTPIEIYLKILTGDSVTPEGTCVGTSSSNVVYVDMNQEIRPTGIGLTEDAQIKFLGIEDKKNFGDRDYNDLVLAIVGAPFIPDEAFFTEEGGYDVNVDQGKRYMIEDLTSTNEFDFNDIVIDVITRETTHHTTTIVNGKKTNDVAGTPTTSHLAILRHLGGTLSWNFKIGGKSVFGKRYGVMDYSPDEVINLDELGISYNPTTNNVSVEIEQVASGDIYYDAENESMNTVSFPTPGSVPMMIATSTKQKWMDEKKTINWGPFAQKTGN